MGIWDKDFDTAYTPPSPATLFGIQSLLPKATHASLASDIGTALKGLQNEMSKANTNAYARELEMLHPEDVLAMEAQGLDPRTARLGNGFIYDPENELIKEAFKNLKSKTSSALTGKVKRAKDRLSKEDIKKLRQKGDITEADLLALAGIDSAFIDDAAIQGQADALNEAFNSQAQNEAMAVLKGRPIDDPLVRALWTGDNSFFTDNGYSPQDAVMLGDALRNSAEGRQLITSRLEDQFNREQARNAINNKPLESAQDWMIRNGYGNSGITINALDPASTAFAQLRDSVRNEENKVRTSDALSKIDNALAGKDKVNLEDLRNFLTSASPDEITSWLSSSKGAQAIGSLNEQFLNKLGKSKDFEKLKNPYLDSVERSAIENAIFSGIDNELKNSNLQNLPQIKSALENTFRTELNYALSNRVADNFKTLTIAEDKLKQDLSEAMQAQSDKSLTSVLRAYMDTGKFEVDDNRISSQQQKELQGRIQSGLDELFASVIPEDHPDAAKVRKRLTGVLMNYVLDQYVDKNLGSDVTVADWMKDNEGAYNLTTQGNGEIIGGKRAMKEKKALMEWLLGNRGRTSDKSDPNTLGGQQEAVRLLIQEMIKYDLVKEQLNQNKLHAQLYAPK